MKIDDAYVKGISVAAIENEKKRAEKEIKISKEKLGKEHPELLFVWEEALKVYNLIISRYPYILNNRDFGERVLQNVRCLNEGFNDIMNVSSCMLTDFIRAYYNNTFSFKKYEIFMPNIW